MDVFMLVSEFAQPLGRVILGVDMKYDKRVDAEIPVMFDTPVENLNRVSCNN
jgi:hypothetical protein